MGNPGIFYSSSRHNIGFFALKELAKLYKISLKRDAKTCSLNGSGNIEGEKVVLAMPMTFMNLSGRSAGPLTAKYKIGISQVLVVCDDLDLEFGRIKIRPAGSSGGHRGLESIMDSLKTKDFARLRIGIGRPHADSNAASYVLSSFNGRERKQLKGILQRAVDCCRMWVAQDIDVCMNTFNKGEAKR